VIARRLGIRRAIEPAYNVAAAGGVATTADGGVSVGAGVSGFATNGAGIRAPIAGLIAAPTVFATSSSAVTAAG
jgi:hypothetical protein